MIILIFCSYKYYCRSKKRNFQSELLTPLSTAEIYTQVPSHETILATASIHKQTENSVQTAEIDTQTVLATASIHTQTEIEPSIQKSHAGIQVDLKQDVAIEFNKAQAPVSDKGKNTFSTGLVTN